jgi:NAD(P)-dependent dehydrogenase (short-subunit alcohol dehydrogenase family)
MTPAHDTPAGSVVVTGAASGIGRATATLFAATHRVVAVDLNGPLVSDLADGSRGAISAYVADVSRERDIVQLFDSVRREFMPLRAICNSAGIAPRGSVEDTAAEEFDRVLATNLRGTFLCCKYAIPLLGASGGGAIVNIASVNAFMAEPTLAAYCASKAGVVGLTRAAAMDHAADGIRVNAICPGLVDTPLARQEPDYLDATSLNFFDRAAQPEEIAEVVVFLASERASFITGAAMCVDAGATAQLTGNSRRR